MFKASCGIDRLDEGVLPVTDLFPLIGDPGTGPALLLYREELIKAAGPLQENRRAANTSQQSGKLSAKGLSPSHSGRENSPERPALTQLKGTLRGCGHADVHAHEVESFDWISNCSVDDIMDYIGLADMLVGVHSQTSSFDMLSSSEKLF